MVFALLSAFGALDDLKLKVQEFFLTNLLPTRHDEIVALLDQFTANTAKLGFLGFAFLTLAAILLLDNIESNFNDIYHVPSRRSFVSKITAYTSVLVFGTLFMGASISISAQVNAMLHVGGQLDLSWISRQLSWLFPLLLAFLAFLVAYTRDSVHPRPLQERGSRRLHLGGALRGWPNTTSPIGWANRSAIRLFTDHWQWCRSS